MGTVSETLQMKPKVVRSGSFGRRRRTSHQNNMGNATSSSSIECPSSVVVDSTFSTRSRQSSIYDTKSELATSDNAIHSTDQEGSTDREMQKRATSPSSIMASSVSYPKETA